MLFRRELVMFGPREVLLTSDQPVVAQSLNGKRHGPIGMSEEKDAAEQAMAGPASNEDVMNRIVPQLETGPGIPERKALRRRHQRVRGILHMLPVPAQREILESLATG
ncbi:hypothetical protein [Parasphingorhabdus pacifica]